MRKVKFADVLKQYKIYHFVDDNTEYRQVTISRHTGVSYRGTKFGRDIGRKRQFVIDLEEYPNTFIFTRQGVQDGSYGIVPQDVHNCVVTENMPMFAVQSTLNPAYLEFYLQTKHFQDQLQALNAAGSAQKSIHENTLLQLDILLPDVDVQKAIVEQIQSVKNKQEIVLTELKTQSNLITKLRSSILSDAVSGRLVPQDSTDEPASVLLERIKIEKERLIKEGKIKQGKPFSLIAEEEIRYQLPEGWTWCRLDDLVSKIGSGSTPSGGQKVYTASGIPFLRSQNVWNDGLRLNDVAYIKNEQHKKMSGTIVYPNDILINITGASIGRAAIAQTNDFTEANVSQHVSIVRLIESTINKYIHVVLISDYIFSEIMNVQVGISREGLSKAKLSNLLIPLPPINEQHRIVAKVEKLMATCDALEVEVAKSRTETDRLMQTVLKEAFEERNETDV